MAKPTIPTVLVGARSFSSPSSPSSSPAAAGTRATTPPPDDQPRLAAPTAERLAVRADTIAAKLAAGDTCGAAHEADALAADADAAVNAGEIPAVYREDLVARTQELANAVNCPPPPVPAADEEADEDEDDDRARSRQEEGEEERDRDEDD